MENKRYFLAVDIGASSGRHILGHQENGRLVLEEMYRFPNGAARKGEYLCWDVDALWGHILAGMRACAKAGKAPVSMGVDTWGVDYVLLDRQGSRIGDAIAYRDRRTEGMPERLAQKLPTHSHFALTGIAMQSFNTVYQLMATPQETLEKAERLLLMPDYLHYLLTGVAANEMTIASTSGMLNAQTRDWDPEVLAAAGIPARLLQTPLMPGTALGALKPEVAAEVGFSCQVVLPATHDTGSAYMAVPVGERRGVFLSSGTWSLIGVESPRPILTPAACDAGFTNEGGYGGSYRFLKNIMGLWMLQCLRREMGERHTFAEMAQMAANAPEVACRVDVSDQRFLVPESMTRALQDAVRKQVSAPLGEAELLRLVHLSLADGYAQAVRQLEAFYGERYEVIHIIGGGSQNVVLNQMTANAAGIPVVAGPTEGTALGNLMAQMIAAGELANLAEARYVEAVSFPPTEYKPQ